VSRQHDRVLQAIFDVPTRSNIAWGDAVSALEGRGVLVVPSGGSRFRLAANGVRIVVHRPHPGAEMSKPLVERIRVFCEQAGIEP
jgi:hypothetical protein